MHYALSFVQQIRFFEGEVALLRGCQMADAELQRMVCGTEARLEPDTPVTVSPPTSTLLPRNHPRKKTSLPVIRSGERAEAPRCFAISTTFGFQLPIFLPSSIWEKCSSWSRCTQPPWSVNWIYGYQPYFSPFSASQIQEYHATCERKHREGEMKTR